MKMSKTILPALTMLLVSAIMLSTASFAWFAMNSSVEANGMQVSVKSDSMYLYIAAAEDDTTELTSGEIINNGGTSDAGIPLDYVTDEGNKVYLTDLYPAAIEENVTTLAALKLPGNWYTASAQSPNASTIDANSKKNLTSFGNYVVRYKYYLTLAEGSNPVSDLRITNFNLAIANGTGSDLPVKVVIASAAGVKQFDSSDNGDVTSFNLLNAPLEENAVACFYVFVYYDGNESTVNTNNLDNIANAEITFRVGIPEQTDN